MSRRAFTLIETLITVTVLALLATAAVMAASAYGGETLESAARVLAADLRLARAQAIGHNTEWTVRFNLKEHSYELVHTGAGNPPPLTHVLAGDAQNYIVRLNQLGGSAETDNGVRIAAAVLRDARTPVADVTFGPLGGTGPARNQDTVIVLAQGEGKDLRTLTVTVSWVTGQVWLEKVPE